MPAHLVAFAVLGLIQQDTAALIKGSERKETAGWTYVKLAGTPYQVGFQHGYLLAAEIDEAKRTLQAELQHDGQSWASVKATTSKVFEKNVEQEYADELRGISDGMRAKGFAMDYGDVLTYNAHIEITGYYLPWQREQAGGPRQEVGNRRESCSAFVATGSQTKDGKVVFGHNFWWGFLMGQRWTYVLDIRPAKGKRLIMDALPGFIHSASDFTINDAGIISCETTISGFFGWDPNGTPEFVRARKAMQYSESLDDYVRIMRTKNNGGYANSWLLADIKTNEIGKLILGIKNVIFHRSTEGAYFGANYPEDEKFIAEEVRGNPGPTLFGCVWRKQRWEALMKQYKGQVDVEMGKKFLADTFDMRTGKEGVSNTTLCGRSPYDLGGATNAKVTSSALAAKMQFWGRAGFPDGGSFSAADYFARVTTMNWAKPYLRDFKPNPWTTMPPGE